MTIAHVEAQSFKILYDTKSMGMDYAKTGTKCWLIRLTSDNSYLNLSLKWQLIGLKKMELRKAYKWVVQVTTPCSIHDRTSMKRVEARQVGKVLKSFSTT